MTQDWISWVSLVAQTVQPVRDGPISKLVGLLMGDAFLIVITGLIVFVLLVYWARHLRNKRRTEKEPAAKRVYQGVNSPEENRPVEQDPVEARKRFKYRWKRRSHRARNPTLAETGGLPSARPEQEAESP